MFTYLFGGALAGSTGSYLRFLLPGSLVMAVVLVTTYSGVTLNTDLTKGTFDRFRSLPIWRPAPRSPPSSRPSRCSGTATSEAPTRRPARRVKPVGGAWTWPAGRRVAQDGTPKPRARARGAGMPRPMTDAPANRRQGRRRRRAAVSGTPATIGA